MCIRRNKTADKRTINTFGQYYLNGAGVATPDPGEAPPLAGFNMKSQVAYNHHIPYLHQIKKKVSTIGLSGQYPFQ
jgi:hypothetical protein